MTWNVTRDTLHRTAKLLLDSGKVRTPEEARTYLGSMVLQVAVGRDIGGDLAAQAALLTVVNAGHRAFLGGVRVLLEDDPPLAVPWGSALTASQAIEQFGGQVTSRLDLTRPTLAIARPTEAVGSPTLHVTHRGWVGGVVESPDALLEGGGIAPAGIVAAALGISEIFQREIGDPVPGRRDVGVSLWRADLDWRAVNAVGPTLQYLPASLWLLGLGHLGQAYAWTLGMLPYTRPRDVLLGLVDYDQVVAGNTATQLLVSENHVGQRKARVVAAALEHLGFDTIIVERAFDANFRTDVTRYEPTIALVGFDSRNPRLLLGNDRFTWVVDGGLGTGPVEYLDIVVNTFPGPEDPAVAFSLGRPHATSLPSTYQAEITSRVARGAGEDAARCGLLDIAGVTIGAAFVGTFAASLVVADLLRLLHGGEPFAVVHVDLRHPENLLAVRNARPGDPTPAYTDARNS